MLHSINKKKIYFYLVSFLFISTIFNSNLISNLKNIFKIKEVKVENVKKEINDNILSNTSFLVGENIFFVSKNILLENKVLGAIELRPTRKFYDYQAKYNPKARTEHIIPVEISKRKYQELTKIALKAHKILNCRGVTRSDFRYYKNSFYLLETNTQPGMTSLSLVPEIANFNNITFKNLIIKILEDAAINK